MLRVRTTQPQAPVPINWGNDLSKGLIFSASPGLAGALEDVTKAALIASPIVSNVVSSFGVGLSQSSGSAYYPATLNAAGTAYTMLVLAGNPYEGRRSNVLMLGDEVAFSNSQVAIALNCNQSGSAFGGTFAFFVYGGGFGAQIEASGYIDTAGTPHVYGAIRNGLAVSLWVDGVKVASNNSGVSVLTNIAQTIYVSGSAAGSTANALNHIASRVWNRALADDEMAQVSANIWQTYQGTLVPWRPTVASTYTMSNATFVPGSITSTGVQAQVNVTVA
jgi:hypothetical protein